MLADVTNRARGARGFQLADGTTRFVEPGTSARLDLAAHVLHRAWEAAGEVAIVPLSDAATEEASRTRGDAVGHGLAGETVVSPRRVKRSS